MRGKKHIMLHVGVFLEISFRLGIHIYTLFLSSCFCISKGLHHGNDRTKLENPVKGKFVVIISNLEDKQQYKGLQFNFGIIIYLVYPLISI